MPIIPKQYPHGLTTLEIQGIMASVRAAVEPLNTALGNSPIIFLERSFLGLPIVNQALVAEFRATGGFFSVRALIKVLGTISIDAVVKAVSASGQPPPPPPHIPTPPPPSQPAVTCGAELDLDQPGSGSIVGMRIFGGGFVPSEMVEILEDGISLATTMVDTLGFYKVHISFLKAQFPVSHTVHAEGRSSGRTSNNAGFTI